MRVLAALLLLLALPAQAQTIGWAQCAHTQTDEKIIEVRVHFMEGDSIYSYRTLKAGTTLKSQVITFKETTRDVLLTAMRLDCTYSMPNLKSLKNSTMPVWPEPIKIPAGQAPKLGILVEEYAPGLQRVFIGKR